MPAFPNWLKQNAALILLCSAAAVLAPTYWTALHSPATGIYNDDSIYLITARTLAEGRGYWIESTPEPMAQTKYPILFPALLSIVWTLSPDFPQNVIYFKLLPFLAAIAWMSLSYLLLRQQTQSPVFSASAIALVASSPQVVFLSTTVLSETLFAALATASLLFMLRHANSNRNSDLILAAIFAAAAYHTRTIGFCLILAGFLPLVWQTRWRQSFLFAFVSGTLALPWLVWQALHRHSPDAYLSQENYYQSFNIVFNFNWEEKFRIAITNLFSLPFSPNPLFDISWGAILGFACIPLILKAFFRKNLPVAIRSYLLFSATAIVLWVWPSLRFLIPLLPLVILAVWSGAPTLLRRALIPCSWILIAQASYANHTFSAKAVESGFWCPFQTRNDEWHSFARQLDWIQKNTKPETIIMATNVDPTVYLFTKRRAVRGAHDNAWLSFYLDRKNVLGSPADYREYLIRNRVNLILQTPWTWFLESKFIPGIIAETRILAPQDFTVVDQRASDPFVIFQFNPSNTPTGNPGQIP